MPSSPARVTTLASSVHRGAAPPGRREDQFGSLGSGRDFGSWLRRRLNASPSTRGGARTPSLHGRGQRLRYATKAPPEDERRRTVCCADDRGDTSGWASAGQDSLAWPMET